MPANLHPSGEFVTGDVPLNSPPDFDRLDRRCRFVCDEFLHRDGEHFAAHAGMTAQSISRQRQEVDGTVPALSKIARLVAAGRALGRSYEDVAAFLRPITDAAECDLEPRTRIVVAPAAAGIVPDLAHAIEEATGAIARVADELRAGNGRIRPHKLPALLAEISEGIDAFRRLGAEVRANAGVTPIDQRVRASQR